MAFRVLLDTNIILDFVLQREDYQKACTLIEWATIGKIQAFITPPIVQSLAYFVGREFGSWQTKEILLTLIGDIQVIELGLDDMISALHSPIPDVEQALKYYTALHHKLDYVITRNEELIKSAIPVLPACTPEEFIKSNS